MSALVWRISAVDTGGKRLELSTLRLWGASGPLDVGANLECSHAPISGALTALMDDDPATSCVWDAADAASPSFWIQWTLPSAVDAWCVRYACQDQSRFMRNYTLGYNLVGRWLLSQQGRVVWPGAGVLTLNRASEPKFDSEIWSNPVSLLVAGNDVFSRCALSGNGAIALVLPVGSSVSFSNRPNMSIDGGKTWTRPAGASGTGSLGFGGCAVSADGSTLVVTGYGSSAKVAVSRDGGATWSNPAGPLATASGFGPCAVSANGMTIVVASVGSGAAINLSKDGGVTWTRPTSLTYSATALKGDCAVSANGMVIAVGAVGGRLTLSRDGGTTWETAGGMTIGGSQGFMGVAISADGSVILAVGYSSTTSNLAAIYISKDGGLTWRVATGSFDGQTSLGPCAMSGNGRVMAVTSGSSSSSIPSHMSFDGGETWRAIGGPTIGVATNGCAISADASTLLIVSYWSGDRLAGLAILRDSTYIENPASMKDVKAGQVLVKGKSFPTPSMRFVSTLPFLDAEAGGIGRIWGTNEIETAPNVKVPTGGRVLLFRRRDKLLVREVWADPVTGAWEFTGLNERHEYLVLAEDLEGNYRPVAANKLVPEVSA